MQRSYREVVNIPDARGCFPVFVTSQFAAADVKKMIAEDNMPNLWVIVPSEGSAAHSAIHLYRLDNLRYKHSVTPEILLCLLDLRIQTPLHYLCRTVAGILRIASPLTAASDVLRFLLRHCRSLAAAQDDNGRTLYDYIRQRICMPIPIAWCCCWRVLLRRCILECCRR